MWKVMENDVDDYTITLTISDTELKIDEDSWNTVELCSEQNQEESMLASALVS